MEEGGKYGYTRLPMRGFLFNHQVKKTQIEMFASKCGVVRVLLLPECYEVLFGFSRCDQMPTKIHLERVIDPKGLPWVILS